MVGAAVAGERAHRKHKEKKQREQREREMHGSSVGGGMAVPHGGGGGGDHPPQPYGAKPQYAYPGGTLNGGGYAETIHSDSTIPPRDSRNRSRSRSNTPPPPQSAMNRGRRGSLGASLVNGLMDHLSGHADKRKALGDGLSPEAIAYKLGQTLGGVTAGGRKE